MYNVITVETSMRWNTFCRALKPENWLTQSENCGRLNEVNKRILLDTVEPLIGSCLFVTCSDLQMCTVRMHVAVDSYMFTTRRQWSASGQQHLITYGSPGLNRPMMNCTNGCVLSQVSTALVRTMVSMNSVWLAVYSIRILSAKEITWAITTNLLFRDIRRWTLCTRRTILHDDQMHAPYCRHTSYSRPCNGPIDLVYSVVKPINSVIMHVNEWLTCIATLSALLSLTECRWVITTPEWFISYHTWMN